MIHTGVSRLEREFMFCYFLRNAVLITSEAHTLPYSSRPFSAFSVFFLPGLTASIGSQASREQQNRSIRGALSK